jgi:hypothetical protein
MTAPTVTMQSPGAAYTTVISTPSGTTYTSNANGLVANVNPIDVQSLMAGGWTIVAPGFSQLTVPLFSGKNSDGSALAAAAAAGKFGNSINLGTASGLVSQVANNSTVSDSLLFELALPEVFKDGYAPTINVDCQLNATTGATLSTKTLTAALYPVGNGGAQSANVVTTAAQAIPSAAGEIEFATSTEALLAGGRVMLELTAELIETAGTNASMTINSIYLD